MTRGAQAPRYKNNTLKIKKIKWLKINHKNMGKPVFRNGALVCPLGTRPVFGIRTTTGEHCSVQI